MPDLIAGRYLVDLLWKIGPLKTGGPLEGPDLESWMRMLGIDAQPWEIETLFQMSQAYAVESQQATKHDAQPAWKEAVPMWRWVRNQRAERAIDRFESVEDRIERRRKRQQEKDRNGNRQ